MALAVKNVFKDEVQVTIGPWIENGYYYDFHKPTGERADKDLKRIKKGMDKIITRTPHHPRSVAARGSATVPLDQGETFKVEVVDNLPDEAEISFYRIGDGRWDLCAVLTWNLRRDQPSIGVRKRGGRLLAQRRK